jgi:hypothetical protein
MVPSSSCKYGGALTRASCQRAYSPFAPRAFERSNTSKHSTPRARGRWWIMLRSSIVTQNHLFGLCEEEHAGGAIAFATFVLGVRDFSLDGRTVLARLPPAGRSLGGSLEQL